MKFKKGISLLLAACLAFSALLTLSACQPGNTPEEGGDIITRTGWFNGLNFNGQTLKVDQSINTWSTSDSIDNAAKYTKGPDTADSGDEVENRCYTRNKNVAATLNISPVFRTTNLFYNEIEPYYDGLFSTNTEPDIIINDIFPVISMSLRGMLANVKTTEATNYFDFTMTSGTADTECWYNDFMEGITLDPNKVYAVAGDYFMDVLRSAHCLYMNTDIYTARVAKEFGDLRDFYDYVEEGNFTYDDFIDMIYLGWDDGHGKVSGLTDEEDVVGYLCANGAGVFPLAFGTNITLVEDSGHMVTDTTDLSNLVSKILKVYSADGTLATTESGLKQSFRDKFVSDGALFLNAYWVGDLEFPSFRNMENKAAIVYPMIDATQGTYRTYVHDSAEIGYIPFPTIRKGTFTACTAYLQLLCEESTNIINLYFNEMLKYRDNTDPQAVKMLDVIHDSIGSSYNQFILNQIATEGGAETKIFNIVTKSIAAGQDKTAELYAANINAYEAGLKSLIQKFATLK